jgi:hypothetical protein
MSLTLPLPLRRANHREATATALPQPIEQALSPELPYSIEVKDPGQERALRTAFKLCGEQVLKATLKSQSDAVVDTEKNRVGHVLKERKDITATSSPFRAYEFDEMAVIRSVAAFVNTPYDTREHPAIGIDQSVARQMLEDAQNSELSLQ